MRTAQCQYQQCAISNTSFQGYPPRWRPKIHSAENKMNIGNVVGDHFVQMCANQKKSYSVCAQAMDAKSQNSFLEAISDFHSMNMCISSPTSTFKHPCALASECLFLYPWSIISWNVHAPYHIGNTQSSFGLMLHIHWIQRRMPTWMLMSKSVQAKPWFSKRKWLPTCAIVFRIGSRSYQPLSFKVRDRRFLAILFLLMFT